MHALVSFYWIKEIIDQLFQHTKEFARSHKLFLQIDNYKSSFKFMS